MLERGGSMLDVDAWNAAKTCAGGPCLLDFHAQNAQQSLRNFNSSLANFLIGVHEHGYFGVGGGWSGAGESACDTCLYQYPEYSKSLGAPKSDSASCGRDDFREFLTGETMKNRYRRAW